MATPCTPLNACTNVDGLVVVQRTIYGPLLGFDSQATLPGINSSGSALRTYVDINFNLNWRSLGLCQGPVTSIMGLAPGEVVTVGLRSRESRSFFQMVQSAAQSSQSSSSQQTMQPAPPRQPSGTSKGKQGGSSLDSLLSLIPLFILGFGSNMTDGSSTGDGAGDSSSADLPDQAANDVGTVVNQVTDPNAKDDGVLQQAVFQTTQILDTVSQSESQSQLQESTATTSDETDLTVQRVFGNPYLDRSLQLRFIPVLNQYEVTISLASITSGLVGFFGEPSPGLLAATTAATANPTAGLAEQAASARPAATFLNYLQTIGDNDNVRRPMINLIRSLSARSDRSRGIRLEQGLAWDRTSVRGNGVHVPLSGFADLVAAWKLSGPTADNLKTNLNKTNPKVVGGTMKPQKQTVSIFAGTHVEAVPGNCVLPDIPDHLKVLVPGAKEQVKSTE